jgi:hypothetical protein
MHSKDTLTKHFGSANLPLVLMDRPFANRDEDIFQMDIVRRARAEAYRLFPGHLDNEVLVQGTDRKLRQLVLYVREPRRAFEVEHSIGGWRSGNRENILKNIRGRVLRETSKIIVEEQFTTDSKRHYLCGHDERNLFIAQLPRGVSTVREAHDVLRAPEARDKNAVRQGEWFFIELSDGEKKIVEHAVGQGLALKDMPLGLAFAQRSSFGRRRRDKRKLLAAHAHLAEEVVVIVADGDRRDRSVTVYARGAVRHVDHKTVNLRSWTRVARNNEPTQTTGGQGIHWID